MESIITGLLVISTIYISIGLVFACFFVSTGVQTIDSAAAKASWGFRLLIFPGSTLFWPWLAKRWFTQTQPKQEFSEHRQS